MYYYVQVHHVLRKSFGLTRLKSLFLNENILLSPCLAENYVKRKDRALEFQKTDLLDQTMISLLTPDRLIDGKL